MRALTLTQPSKGRRVALSYLSGVLHGDAWLTSELGLRCADRDFVEAFAAALKVAFDVNFPPRRDERGYWLIRRGNQSGRFDMLRTVTATTRAEIGAWLRGLFDSEGNAQLHRVRGGPNCFGRRVAMYSTARVTLARALEHLATLDIAARIRLTKNSAGHKGDKPVHELVLSGGRENYDRFRTRVSASIKRKRDALDSIIASYKPDLSAHCREIQLRGAATKRRRTLGEVIPTVIAAIRARIEAGLSVSMSALSKSVPGYHTARNHMRHSELVANARAS